MNAGTQREDLTAEEKEFLQAVYPSDQGIEEGKLYSSQVDLLNQKDYAEEYLKRKYPSYEFKIKDALPISGNGTNATFYFTNETDRENADSNYYSITVYVDETDKKEILFANDSFYGVLIEGDFAELFRKRFTECDITCDRINVVISGAFDEVHDETYNVNAFLLEDKKYSTQVFFDFKAEDISNQTYEELFAQVEEIATDMNLFGSYVVTVRDNEEILFERWFNVSGG